jgi:hypothetical protein
VLQAAKPLLRVHAPRCNRVPHATHAVLLLPLLQLNQLEAAAKHHRDYLGFQHDEDSLPLIALHLEFLGYLGDVPAGLKLLERHLAWAYRSQDIDTQYDFLRCTLPLLHRVRHSKHLSELDALPLERMIPDWQATESVESAGDNGVLDALERRIRSDLHHIAVQFDTRHGNTFYQGGIQPDLALLERPAQGLPVVAEKVKTKNNNAKGRWVKKKE